MLDVVTGLEIVGRGPRYLVARNDHVVVVQLDGEVTDDVGNAWRACMQADFEKRGMPRFGFVEATEGRSVGSLQGKLRSASFMRMCAQTMKHIALVSSSQGNFVIKSVMRVAGAANVELVPLDDGQRVLDAFKAGVDPFG